jgi:hypothetical protein
MSGAKYRTFILSYDATFELSKVNFSALHALISTSNYFSGWLFYIPGLYLLASDRTADEISALVRPFFAPTRYFVCEINPFNNQGNMPQEFWREMQKARDASPTSTANALSPPTYLPYKQQ